MAAKRLKHDCKEDKSRFVFELPLRTTPTQESEIEIRIQAYRHIKNACLGEAMRRLDLCRESREYQAARLLPKGEKGTKEQKTRTKAFRSLIERFEFN